MRAQAIKNTTFGGGAAQVAQLSSAVDTMDANRDQSAAASGPTQEIVIQGSVVSVDTLEDLFREAREQNIEITGVTRG